MTSRDNGASNQPVLLGGHLETAAETAAAASGMRRAAPLCGEISFFAGPQCCKSACSPLKNLDPAQPDLGPAYPARPSMLFGGARACSRPCGGLTDGLTFSREQSPRTSAAEINRRHPPAYAAFLVDKDRQRLMEPGGPGAFFSFPFLPSPHPNPPTPFPPSSPSPPFPFPLSPSPPNPPPLFLPNLCFPHFRLPPFHPRGFPWSGSRPDALQTTHRSPPPLSEPIPLPTRHLSQQIPTALGAHSSPPSIGTSGFFGVGRPPNNRH